MDELKKNYMEFQKEISNVRDTDTIYYWYGQNAIEICGLMYTLELLKDKWKNVYFINVSDLPIKVKYGIHIPRCTGEIMPEKFSEYIKINRKIDKDEYIKWLTQWKVLKKENSILRILKDGKVENVDEDYFDIFILKYTPKEFKKSARIIGEVLGYITKQGLEYLKKDDNAIKFWEKRNRNTEEEKEIIEEYINMGRLEEKLCIRYGQILISNK